MDSALEAILGKVTIKTQDMIQLMMVNEGEAGAINKAKLFIGIFNENCFCFLLNLPSHIKDLYVSFGKVLHKGNSTAMSCACTNECISFSENKIGSVKETPLLKDIFYYLMSNNVELI